MADTPREIECCMTGEPVKITNHKGWVEVEIPDVFPSGDGIVVGINTADLVPVVDAISGALHA